MRKDEKSSVIILNKSDAITFRTLLEICIRKNKIRVVGVIDPTNNILVKEVCEKWQICYWYSREKQGSEINQVISKQRFDIEGILFYGYMKRYADWTDMFKKPKADSKKKLREKGKAIVDELL